MFPPAVKPTGSDPTLFEVRQYCFPDGLTLGQIRQVVMKFMADKPELLHTSAERLVGQSLEKASRALKSSNARNQETPSGNRQRRAPCRGVAGKLQTSRLG